MKSRTGQGLLLRRLLFKCLTVILAATAAAAIVEIGFRVYFAEDRDGFQSLRSRLAGEVAFADLQIGYQKCMGQPYLLYAPAPNYQKGENYHNEQGYRGKAVPYYRVKGIARIVCLGGSTTYGAKVENADQTYPAQLEHILRNSLPSGFKDVEVINGGLEFATSAELLTHYHFKFHYFRPDLVIINTGGNDTSLVTDLFYQPDYSHKRRHIGTPQPLSQFGQVLLKSHFGSWVAMQLLYGRQYGNQWIERPENLPPPAVWHPAAKQPGLYSVLPDEELAFLHNLETLVELIVADGAQALLVPFRLAPDFEHHYDHQSAYLENERLLRQVAAEHDLRLAPFPADVISRNNWADPVCHLTSEGCREKAAYIAPYAAELLSMTLKQSARPSD